MKKALLILMLLSGTLLLGTHQATAAPAPLDPPEIRATAEPRPCPQPRLCDLTLPTRAPEVEDPAEPAGPPTTTTSSAAEVPSAAPESTSAAPATVSKPAAAPRTVGTTAPVEPAAPATATSVAAVAAPADTATPAGPAGPDWWLLIVPAVALLTLAAYGAVLVIRRTERHPA